MKQEMEESIDRYLMGEMGETEKSAFEQSIKGDEQLQRQVALHAELLQAIHEAGKQEDEEIFNQMKLCNRRTLEKAFTKKEYPIYKRFIIWGVTAAAILALTFGLKRHFDSQLYDRIYDRFYEPHPELMLDRGGYDNRDYEHALKLWQEGSAEESITELTEIVKAGDSHPHYEDACWNLALFYLKTRQKTEAIEVLEKIINEKGYYAEKATIVLEELQSSKIP